jgi:hypothetical protein
MYELDKNKWRHSTQNESSQKEAWRPRGETQNPSDKFGLETLWASILSIVS